MIRVVLGLHGVSKTVSHVGERVEMQQGEILVDGKRLCRWWEPTSVWLDEHRHAWKTIVFEAVDARAAEAVGS